MFSIRRSFSAKLSLGILLMAVPIFVISLGLLFTQSRQMIRSEATGRANSVLKATMQRICRNLATIETATEANSWLITQYTQPDSLLALSHRIVQINPHIDGCSISTEPDVFPKYGRYFSAYSVKNGDSVSTVIEEKYEYFEKIWYKTPRIQGKPCWVVYYDEADSLGLTLDGMVASYCKPIYDTDGRFLAVITADLSLLRLSKVISAEEKRYPHSYFMMVENDGRYFIHPDSTKLFKQTLFSGVDPQQQPDLITLGHEMMKGNQGHMQVVINGAPCLVCYQPVLGTTWSLALVCPDSDVMKSYHQLTYIIIPLLIVGLIIIILFSHRAVKLAIHPLNQLLEKTQTIASGNMEVHIPKSQRKDVVGRLQNSFATMLQSLNFHMGSVRYSTEQAQHRNEELVQVTHLAQVANRQKTAFIQNVSHQIRTPLNIVMGFAQILNGPLSDNEKKSIAKTMKDSSTLLNRLIAMLFDSSDYGRSKEEISNKHEKVNCNDVAHEAIHDIHVYHPEVRIKFNSSVSDDFCIYTNRLNLMRSLRELLYNAIRYSDGENIMIAVELGPKKTDGPKTIRFVVQDTGKGIAESDRELIFNFFTKIDDLSEGLGLGLPLSKRHAQNLGGDLTLDTSYQDGCRFIITLPIE